MTRSAAQVTTPSICSVVFNLKTKFKVYSFHCNLCWTKVYKKCKVNVFSYHSNSSRFVSTKQKHFHNAAELVLFSAVAQRTTPTRAAISLARCLPSRSHAASSRTLLLLAHALLKHADIDALFAIRLLVVPGNSLHYCTLFVVRLRSSSIILRRRNE